MKCFALNINIFSSPHDVMQIARINKLFVQERKCLFLSEISEIFDGVRNIRTSCLHKQENWFELQDNNVLNKVRKDHQ